MKPYWLLLAAFICVFAPGCSGGGADLTEEENAEIENTDVLTEDEAAIEEAAENSGEGGDNP